MTMEIAALAFRQGVSDVDDAADRLRADRAAASRRVEALLDGGWRGDAATAFGGAFADWLAGAQDVLDGLVAMARLMRAAEATLHHSDTDAVERLQVLSGRLVERLS